jgi:hypothetical protein
MIEIMRTTSSVVMPGAQSSLRRLRKPVCAAGHPRLERRPPRKRFATRP